MSTYNLAHGMNKLTVFIVPMLFDKHPDELCRYCDCFVVRNGIELLRSMVSREVPLMKVPKYERSFLDSDSGEVKISILARSTHSKKEDTECYLTKDFLCDTKGLYLDDDYKGDDTYTFYHYNVPEKWRSDLDLILEDRIKEVSDDLKSLVYKCWPKIEKELKRILE